MEVEEALDRLGNTDSFFEHLKPNSKYDSELGDLKALALREIEKVYSILSRITYKQEFTKQVREVISYNIRELQSLDSDRLHMLLDFEDMLKNGILKEFYVKKNVDLTHQEQMLLISYMQDLKFFPQVSDMDRNGGFFTIFSALINRNEKNSQKYLYAIKDKKMSIRSLEKILAIFKKAKSQEGQKLVMNDINKLKKDQ